MPPSVESGLLQHPRGLCSVVLLSIRTAAARPHQAAHEQPPARKTLEPYLHHAGVCVCELQPRSSHTQPSDAEYPHAPNPQCSATTPLRATLSDSHLSLVYGVGLKVGLVRLGRLDFRFWVEVETPKANHHHLHHHLPGPTFEY
jgi:hypothetical protein